MSKPNRSEQRISHAQQKDGESKSPGYWDNPSIPVGDAPPRSRWTLVLLVVAWGGWMLFLVAMMLSSGVDGSA